MQDLEARVESLEAEVTHYRPRSPGPRSLVTRHGPCHILSSQALPACSRVHVMMCLQNAGLRAMESSFHATGLATGSLAQEHQRLLGDYE